jgi:hypothetical protein
MLGQHCSEEDGQIVASILQVETTSFDEKYLGLPILEGRMKNDKLQSEKKDYKTRARTCVRNTCPMQPKKTLLNQWCKPSPPTL